MAKKKLVMGDTMVSKLTSVLFYDGVTPVTQDCFEFLLKGTGQKIREYIVNRCMDISADKYKEITGEDKKVETISSLVVATFIACPVSKQREEWLRMITLPLSKTSDKKQNWPEMYGSTELETYAIGVITGLFQFFTLSPHDICILGETTDEHEKLEQVFADIMAMIITNPSQIMYVILPADRQKSLLGSLIKNYAAPRDLRPHRKKHIQSLLKQVREYLPPGDENPWSGGERLLNFWFSQLLLEKIIFSVFGSNSILRKLDILLDPVNK